MSCIFVPRSRSSLAFEGASWVGLTAGLLLLISAMLLPSWPVPTAHASFGPADLTAWAQAICAAIGLITTTANGVAILWHRWGKPPRKPKSPKPKAGA